MQRHSLIVRFGRSDSATIHDVDPMSLTTELQLVAANRRVQYGIADTLEEIQRIGIAPTEVAVDLLILAATVYCADTRIKRGTESQDNWTREIDLHVPVSDPPLWNTLVPLLQLALEFLTGDKWRLRFRSRPNSFRRVVEVLAQASQETSTSVCLFSGGIDSFVGAIDLLTQGQRPLLVSHSWVGNSSEHQRLCLVALGKEFGREDVRQIRSRIGFPKGIVAGIKPEDTERSRSFLFFALAAIVASGLQKPGTIYIPENGLITLNVPLDPLRIGSLSTRTTHPFFVARFNDLLLRLGIQARLENPYRHKTKGEMVRECRKQALLARHVAQTMSCSSPNKGRFQGHAPGHCGHCVPCIIRRAALMDWKHSDSTRYALQDLRARPLHSTAAEGEHVRSFQLAIHRLDSKLNRARVVIHEPGPLTDVLDEIEEFAKVYLRGMREVERLLTGVITSPDA